LNINWNKNKISDELKSLFDRFDPTDREKLRNRIVTALIIVLLVFFIFNLLRFNHKTDTDEKTLKTNMTTVKNSEQVSIRKTQAAIDRLNYKDETAGKNVHPVKKNYSRLFNRSAVIGDSLVEGLTVYGYLSKSEVYSKVGASVKSTKNLFIDAAKNYPKFVILAYGMNEMGNFNGNAAAFTKVYMDDIRAFKKISPDTKVCVTSISAPTDKAMSKNKSLRGYRKFNKAIKAMCKKNKLCFIDITDILINRPDLYAEDGIHAKPAYYPLWLNRVIEEAGIK